MDMENNNQLPEETVESPEETVEVPEETVESPEETVEVPEETVDIPEETVETPEKTEDAPEKSKQTGKIVVIALLCIALLASLTIAVLAGSGILFGEETPETTVPETTVVETTEPVEMKSYSVDFETAKAKAEDVVATAGDAELTNGELQVYYWMGIYDFISSNSYWIPYMGVDFTQPLDQQVYDAQKGTSWQEAMLDYALQTWHQYESIRQFAEGQGYELNEEGKAYVENLEQTIQQMLETYHYNSIQEMLDTEMGAGATEAGYKEYLTAGNYAIRFMTDARENLTLSDEELEQYFAENEETLTASGITKDSGDTVDVRHILVKVAGGTEDENGTVTYSDEDWETCRQAAQAIYDQWKAGDANEEFFGQLATEKTEDGGSKANGGLYTGVSQGQMVKEFDSWIFDESRQYGDTDLVKTSFGYHIMFFVGREPVWKTQCLNNYQSEKLNEIIVAATALAPMNVNYDAIVIGQAKTE